MIRRHRPKGGEGRAPPGHGLCSTAKKGRRDKKNGVAGEGRVGGITDRCALIPAVFVGDSLDFSFSSRLASGHATKDDQALPLLTSPRLIKNVAQAERSRASCLLPTLPPEPLVIRHDAVSSTPVCWIDGLRHCCDMRLTGPQLVRSSLVCWTPRPTPYTPIRQYPCSVRGTAARKLSRGRAGGGGKRNRLSHWSNSSWKKLRIIRSGTAVKR